MIFQMITSARNRWFNSKDCTVNELIDYMVAKGEMRESQIDAIKTYLYLKIHCENKPIYQLMIDGVFNEDVDLENIELKSSTKQVLENNKSAMALYQYSLLKDDDGNSIFAKLNEEIRKNTENINFNKAIKAMFNNVSFSNYIYSLPMGAGKTYLMASFIYLDLYFALNEPTNKAFAHNFIICAPSGLKSSVIPSLKTIKDFDATWILPSEAVKQIKEILKFEILDEDKTANKSNKIKNPNVQKIASHQPFDSLIGLVMVTNAEKVILDNIRVDKKSGQLTIDDYTENEKAMNELKKFIAKIPHLAVLVDEVHHLADENIKLNSVVEYWKSQGNMNCLIGFSGTPYYNTKQAIYVSDTFSYGVTQIPFVVNHYPLISAIETFLKKPLLTKTDNRDYLYIIEKGLKDFFDRYKDTVYEDGTCAKVAIYCGRIAKLREEVYQKCTEIVNSYRLNPDEAILCYHGDDSKSNYTCSAREKEEWTLLDNKISKVRIVLLAQIGKEGWNCKSLTGVILSQEGDCPRNMILQTTCRCLRQVDKNNNNETALICLNDYNYKILDEELNKEQHTSIEQINNLKKKQYFEINRYDRTKKLKLPPIEIFQLKVHYENVKFDDKLTIEQRLKNIKPQKQSIRNTEIKNIADRENSSIEFQESYGNEYITYSSWLHTIAKESFGLLKLTDLLKYNDILTGLFNKITVVNNDVYYLNKLYNNDEIKSEIRKAFQDKYTFTSREELIGETKNLLNKENFTDSIKTDDVNKYYPTKQIVDKLILADNRNSPYTEQQEYQYKILIENGMEDLAREKFALPLEIENRNKTFHYVPYNFSQSEFEETTFKDMLKLTSFKNNNLEIYYNGDRGLTEFKIKCYKKNASAWYYIGMYTPDFLILQRKDNKIYKALIIETKGSGYANDTNFNDKKEFVKTKFLEINKNRFDFFYIQDNENQNEALERLNNTIIDLFKE